MCFSSALLALVNADKQYYNADTAVNRPVSAVECCEIIHIENGYRTVSM
ncbi:hypothetical protein BBSC_0050 [Bifidobacterium scardovii JCM 12489 = DSM 13734]|nr:hypothetical protein BBSC_0050 [Bifidobacterium scardovii JCM 12489 = DSM 13734]